MCPLERKLHSPRSGRAIFTASIWQQNVSESFWLPKLFSECCRLRYHPYGWHFIVKTSRNQCEIFPMLSTMRCIYSNDLHIHCYSRRRYKTFDNIFSPPWCQLCATNEWTSVAQAGVIQSYFLLLSLLFYVAQKLFATRVFECLMVLHCYQPTQAVVCLYL